MGTIVTRDGRDVSPVLPDENAAVAWLLRVQSQSIWHAMRFEGYGFRETREGDE